jgi:hypothetical protein
MSSILLLLVLATLWGCISESEPIETFNSQANIIKSGDIIVVNTATDSVLLLDDDGTYKTTIYSARTDATVTIPAITWDSRTNRLLIMYDSTTATLDKILSVDPYDLSISTAYQNSTILTATGLNGVARLTTGDLVVIESTATMEKFDTAWTRQGAPFMNATLAATAADVAALSSGAFVVASSATATSVRSYNSAGTLVTTVSSTTPAPSLGAAVACTGVAMKGNGKVVAAFSGATDGVRQYSSDLSTVDWNFINATVLSTPTKIAVRANGNSLVPDSALNHIVEIDSSGVLVGTFASSILATPGSIVVVP